MALWLVHILDFNKGSAQITDILSGIRVKPLLRTPDDLNVRCTGFNVTGRPVYAVLLYFDTHSSDKFSFKSRPVSPRSRRPRWPSGPPCRRCATRDPARLRPTPTWRPCQRATCAGSTRAEPRMWCPWVRIPAKAKDWQKMKHSEIYEFTLFVAWNRK